MQKLKRAVIKEELYALTEDTLEAVILNQFIYWSERVHDFDKFIQEEKERVEKFGDINTPPVQMELTHGWIYKKSSELKDEIMVSDSVTTVRRAIKRLVDKGYLEERNNPHIKYDRTLQYRINLVKVQEDLHKLGYVLQGYKVDLKQIQNESSKMQGEESKNQIDVLKNQIDVLKKQLESAIPKTTIKTYSNKRNNIFNRPSSERIYSDTDIKDMERKLLGRE